ncbi:MAG: Bro-N domain-containing protein, partial [Synergistaceae bacterium]|nr:Bro-N domain-containing protein [Synergistaceae bacterium]
MTNALQVFDFNENAVRVIMKDDQPWFVAKDVCEILDIADAHTALRGLDSDEKDRQNLPTPGGEQDMSVINESGLYTLIMRSNKPEAKKFRKWVTSEVLPAI